MVGNSQPQTVEAGKTYIVESSSSSSSSSEESDHQDEIQPVVEPLPQQADIMPVNQETQRG